MYAIISINTELCVGCAYCLMICPIKSFRVEGVSHFLQKCTKCRLCITICPVSAIIPNWED
ncbi:MAG: 4Fe-4S binding protein [Candidatus Hodarchaeota archaeon]